MAIESVRVIADMVGSVEFPHLANKYSVFAVPKAIINEKVEVEGAVPPKILLEKIKDALTR